jgi:DNA-binding IclR family transcriptional regulator
MVVLAFMGEKERRRILKNLAFKAFTENTITDPDKLEVRLAEIYKCGVAYNLHEFHNGINAMATPIFDRQNRVLGALAIVGTSVDLDREQLEEYSRLFLRAGSDISGVLGGKYPERLLKEGKNG